MVKHGGQRILMVALTGVLIGLVAVSCTSVEPQAPTSSVVAALTEADEPTGIIQHPEVMDALVAAAHAYSNDPSEPNRQVLLSYLNGGQSGGHVEPWNITLDVDGTVHLTTRIFFLPNLDDPAIAAYLGTRTEVQIWDIAQRGVADMTGLLIRGANSNVPWFWIFCDALETVGKWVWEAGKWVIHFAGQVFTVLWELCTEGVNVAGVRVKICPTIDQNGNPGLTFEIPIPNKP